MRLDNGDKVSFDGFSKGSGVIISDEGNSNYLVKIESSDVDSDIGYVTVMNIGTDEFERV